MSKRREDDTFAPLTCDAILYRPIIDEKWIDKKSGDVKAAAFRRRRADQHGLSVNVAASYSVEECVESENYNECFAVGTLHTGRILDIPPLGMLRDSLTHANITGLPAKDETGPPHDENRERLANQLRDQWRPIWYSRKMAPKKV